MRSRRATCSEPDLSPARGKGGLYVSAPSLGSGTHS